MRKKTTYDFTALSVVLHKLRSKPTWKDFPCMEDYNRSELRYSFYVQVLYRGQHWGHRFIYAFTFTKCFWQFSLLHIIRRQIQHCKPHNEFVCGAGICYIWSNQSVMLHNRCLYIFSCKTSFLLFPHTFLHSVPW